jgi:regulator of replication initiation timing
MSGELARLRETVAAVETENSQLTTELEVLRRQLVELNIHPVDVCRDHRRGSSLLCIEYDQRV